MIGRRQRPEARKREKPKVPGRMTFHVGRKVGQFWKLLSVIPIFLCKLERFIEEGEGLYRFANKEGHIQA